jgi:hypothetical protein
MMMLKMLKMLKMLLKMLMKMLLMLDDWSGLAPPGDYLHDPPVGSRYVCRLELSWNPPP